ncbi:S24 family peptidase [Olivibacter ginsenosidimutans]
MTLEQFYGNIATHVNNFSAIENGSRIIGKRLSKDIIDYHHINLKWLKNKEGTPFLSQVPDVHKRQKNTLVDQEPISRDVPFYNMQLADMVFEGPNAFQEVPEFYVNFRPFNDCTAYLPIYGDSMYPKFASGEIIAVKEVLNKNVIQWGEAYLVVANEQANNMVTVKLLYEHQDKSKLILRAVNPDFQGDTVVEKEAIVRLFIVKGKITRSQL